MKSNTDKQVIFIQNAIPPLHDGEYVLSATQTVPGQEPGSFAAQSTFIVQGERFTIAPTEIDSVFPPNLANGEFDSVLPHVVLNRSTLPWERDLGTPKYPDSPWLAVLLCDDLAGPSPYSHVFTDVFMQKPTVRAVTAKDLVPAGTKITVLDSNITGTGTLVATTLSYGAAVLGQLGYGETPDDPCTVIDLPLWTFNQIAPAAADMQYLAHIREVDTSDGPDSNTLSEQHAVVIGNRIPRANGVAHAFLVSLEGMADYLPAADGTQSAKIGPAIDTVRLIVYRSWSFTTNDMDQSLERLLEGLNAPAADGTRITTLTLPIAGPAPSPARVAQAMTNQASGNLSSDDATVLMQNALLLGYVPMNHHLRHGGNTVSFYRGPLVPLAVPAGAPAYYTGPDGANAYNPQTGLFDVSYGAAWQLGHLLALQNSGMANELYQWKRSVRLQQAMSAEQALLTERLQGAAVFESFFARRRAALPPLSLFPPLPDNVQEWFRNLAKLQGVPFNYLVPDERMLPPESIRFFYLDHNWMDALIDGAFSVGRATVSGQSLETQHAHSVRGLARDGAGRRATNRRRAVHTTADAQQSTGTVTGFLIRSQAVAGWPNLRIVGYSDLGASMPIDPVRISPLSSDTLMCLFDGEVASTFVREPPEQLHHGVEGERGGYYTTLRSVDGGPGDVQAGQQYPNGPSSGTQPIPMRAGDRTVEVSSAAAIIQSRLSGDFKQKFDKGFTAAEFALELTKGVLEVEFRR